MVHLHYKDSLESGELEIKWHIRHISVFSTYYIFIYEQIR